jgi:L-2-hydroxycarboxylate dehydrogenase (NAD+)
MNTEQIYINIPVKQLETFMCDVFISSGVPADDAEICARVLITSDLRGIESHGIGRLKMYYDRIKSGILQPVTQLEMIRESATTALIDAHHGMGMVVGYKSMQLAIEKAHHYGMGSVAVRNSSHFGIDGYYPLMAAEAGMIGMSFTNARPAIAPTFGVQPMLGTNPIAFSAPSDEPFPFIFDAATSITQRGKIEVHARIEKPIPEGWVIDTNGNDITDPAKTLSDLSKETAALLPLGGAGELTAGHKGYGLAVMVEILSSALQNGAFLYGLTGIASDGSNKPHGLGHFFMAIDIEAFTDLSSFKKTTGDILRELRAARKAPGRERIFTAGEKEYENEIKIRESGVPVPPTLQKEIKQIQKELGLSQYDFPF